MQKDNQSVLEPIKYALESTNNEINNIIMTNSADTNIRESIIYCQFQNQEKKKVP